MQERMNDLFSVNEDVTLYPSSPHLHAFTTMVEVSDASYKWADNELRSE